MYKAQITANRPLTIVAVHGVGDAVPGALSIDLSNAITTTNPSATFVRSDLLIKGATYPRLLATNVQLGGRPLHAIVEVNWADVLRPANSAWQVVKHILMLITGLRILSVQPVVTNGVARSPSCARLFWFFMESIAWWASSLVIVVMLLHSCGQEHDIWLKTIAVGSPIVVCFTAFSLRRFSRTFLAGILWAPVFALAGMCYCRGMASWYDSCVAWSTFGYVVCQFGASILLLLSFGETAVIMPQTSRVQKSARAGMTWIPFVIIAALGVGNWIFSLLFAANFLDEQLHDNWQRTFLSAIRYDLLWSEVGTMVSVVMTFVIIPCIAVIAYFSSNFRRLVRLPDQPGACAHRMIQTFLVVGPFVMIAGASIFWITLCTGSNQVEEGRTVLQAYAWSAGRFLGVLPLFLPVARTLLDVAGDVIFHLQPAGSPVDSKNETLPRLKVALSTVRRHSSGEICLLAHSQGSVIAWTILMDVPHVADKLLTIGSPLSTLYSNLLGGNFGSSLSQKVKWSNRYKTGDYIGGPVTGCPDNQELGSGGHVGYWGDLQLVRDLWP